MNWNEFYQSLRDDDLAPVYLFTGPEEYIKREALHALRDKLLPPGLEALNDMTLEGVTAQQITDAAQTLPMMCDKRVLTVRDWAPLLPARSKNEEAEAEWMQRWLEKPAETCALVFYMRQEPDGRKKMTALLKKKAVVVDFQPLTDAEMTRWVAGRLKPCGKKMAPAALNLLTLMAGRDLTRLCGEVDKLASYAGDDRAEITPQDVRDIVSPSLEYNIFELLNYLLSGDLKQGQQMLNALLQGGQTSIGILAMLTRQIRQLTHMKAALAAGGNVQQVQSALKMHPYAAKQTARQCARLSAEWLTALYERCVDSDFEVKSGRLRDKDALDSLILHIALAAKPNR